MKKLSDYRIREQNGKFYIELMVEEIEKPFLKKRTKNIKWVPTSVDGDRIIRYNGIYLYEPCNAFNTIKEAKVQIIQWCEEPKYHYVVEFSSEIGMVRPESEPINGKYYITQSVPPMDIPCPWDLSRADIEYLEKRRAEKENKDIIFINEALKINPLFYKLIEKYEERVKSGWNPKTIEKSYADLTLENFELTIKNKELEIKLHELKKKPNNDQR